MGALISCCFPDIIKADQSGTGATSELVELDPFECTREYKGTLCGGTLTEHGCIKCHKGPQCDDCGFPIAPEGNACTRCAHEEAIENCKDRSSKNRSKKHASGNEDFNNSDYRLTGRI
jgi:hypothetical protein